MAHRAALTKRAPCALPALVGLSCRAPRVCTPPLSSSFPAALLERTPRARPALVHSRRAPQARAHRFSTSLTSRATLLKRERCTPRAPLDFSHATAPHPCTSRSSSASQPLLQRSLSAHIALFQAPLNLLRRAPQARTLLLKPRCRLQARASRSSSASRPLVQDSQAILRPVINGQSSTTFFVGPELKSIFLPGAQRAAPHRNTRSSSHLHQSTWAPCACASHRIPASNLPAPLRTGALLDAAHYTSSQASQIPTSWTRSTSPTRHLLHPEVKRLPGVLESSQVPTHHLPHAIIPYPGSLADPTPYSEIAPSHKPASAAPSQSSPYFSLTAVTCSCNFSLISPSGHTLFAQSHKITSTTTSRPTSPTTSLSISSPLSSSS